MKNKKILITGNKGFIGNSILEKFRKSNKIIGISKNKYLKLKKNTFLILVNQLSIKYLLFQITYSIVQGQILYINQ